MIIWAAEINISLHILSRIAELDKYSEYDGSAEKAKADEFKKYDLEMAA